MPALTTGQIAPPFELAGLDGGRFSLREALAHGPLVAAFFKVSCPTCQFTFPYLERLAKQLREAGAHGVQVWGISQDNAKHSREFVKDFGVTFPILIDDDPHEVSREYGLVYVPSIFLIASDGHIEISSDGFSKADLLAIHRSLASLYAVKPAELFRPNERIPKYKPG